MAQQKAVREQSHLGFFAAILGVAVLAWAGWWFVGNNYFTTQQQMDTAASNPGMPKRARDKDHKAEAPPAERPQATADNR